MKAKTGKGKAKAKTTTTATATAAIGTGNNNGMNTETRKLHQALVAQVKSLSELLGTTTDPNDAQALLVEMQELNFRVMMSGSLLFKQTTAAIDARIDGVVQASNDLDASLKQLTRINDIIRATSKFLGIVDKVLDAIKLL